MNDKELIAEARSVAMNADWFRGNGNVLTRLADALESATRVPVQGEPNDDREVLARELREGDDPVNTWEQATEKQRNYWRGEAEYQLAFRATVPDAATELAAIKARADEVGEDEGWHIGGAWGDYGEVVVPLRILSYVVDGALDEKIVSTDPGYAATYAEQVARADRAEAERDAALAAVERVRAIHLPVALETKTVCNSCAEEWPCDTRAALDGAPEPDNDDPCDAEVYSWDYYRAEQIDSYWIRCTLLGKHDEHEDSHTGLKWRSGLPVEGEKP